MVSPSEIPEMGVAQCPESQYLLGRRGHKPLELAPNLSTYPAHFLSQLLRLVASGRRGMDSCRWKVRNANLKQPRTKLVQGGAEGCEADYKVLPMLLKGKNVLEDGLACEMLRRN